VAAAAGGAADTGRTTTKGPGMPSGTQRHSRLGDREVSTASMTAAESLTARYPGGALARFKHPPHCRDFRRRHRCEF